MKIDNEQWTMDILKAIMEKVVLPIDESAINEAKGKKEKLLILGGQQGDMDNLKLDYDLVYVNENQITEQVDTFDAVILCKLDNCSLSKLAVGITDNAYLNLVAEAILSGKKVYALTEGIQFCQYKKTAPPSYYQIFESHLDTLKKSGLQVCEKTELTDCLLQKNKSVPMRTQPVVSKEEPKDVKHLTKKVITEKDIIALKRENIFSVQIGNRCIITDLAKEFAKKHKITISCG